MDFFNDTLEKAKDVFDIACKKTGEAVTVQKQKIEIAAIEHKRSKDLEELGILYYKSLKNTEIENAEIKALFDAITEKNEKIANLKRDIETAKNRIVCPNCAASINADSIFCNVCGEKL